MCVCVCVYVWYACALLCDIVWCVLCVRVVFVCVCCSCACKFGFEVYGAMLYGLFCVFGTGGVCALLCVKERVCLIASCCVIMYGVCAFVCLKCGCVFCCASWFDDVWLFVFL